VQRARSETRAEHASPDVLHRLLDGFEHGHALLDDDAALREELRGLLLSAHETTALALSWTLHELAHAPDELAAVHAELDDVFEHDRAVTIADLPKLTRVRAAFEEALRLRGGTFIVRGTLEHARLDHADATIPAGYDVMASMWVTHRDPRWWNDPLEYRASRFVEPDPSRPRFAWYPFGGGRRTCIGMHLAAQTAVLSLATLLRDWTLEPRSGDPPVRPISNVLVRPQRPIVLRRAARTRRD
jgi:cytochrome P450